MIMASQCHLHTCTSLGFTPESIGRVVTVLLSNQMSGEVDPIANVTRCESIHYTYIMACASPFTHL